MEKFKLASDAAALTTPSRACYNCSEDVSLIDERGEEETKKPQICEQFTRALDEVAQLPQSSGDDPKKAHREMLGNVLTELRTMFDRWRVPWSSSQTSASALSGLHGKFIDAYSMRYKT